MSSSLSDSSSSTPFKVPTIRAVCASTTFSSNSYITPPTKRGGTLPSFIPQPVSSPSPMRSTPVPSKPKVVPTSTFIRQPTRKPLLLPSVPTKAQNITGGSNGSALILPTIVTHLPTNMSRTQPRPSSAASTLPTRLRK
jgi:hypothetical protein